MSITGSATVTASETRIGVTVKVIDPVMLPEVALMLVVPAATPVPRPELFTVATPVAEDDHVALPVISTWDASL